MEVWREGKNGEMIEAKKKRVKKLTISKEKEIDKGGKNGGRRQGQEVGRKEIPKDWEESWLLLHWS